MIDEIQVENLALIREATLVPARGLTVLTGETGAGKTALLSALKLLMGARADKDAVRDGEDSLTVSGRFYGIASADGSESDAALAAGDFDELRELVATRRVTADGRSRVSIDGRMASVGELARAVASTIDLCGQHEHQQLMKTSQHVRMLDAWAGEAVAQAHAAYEEALATANAAAAELARVREAGEASSAKLDEARFVLQRIDAVDPREGEYDELLEELARVEHAETLVVSANTAHEALAGEQGAIDALGSAISALDGAARYDAKLGEFADALREAGYVLEDMARETRDYREGVEFDPEALAQQQERMASLQGLLRMYGPRMEDVLARRAEAADLVSLVDDAAERERAAQQELDRAEEALAQAAAVLTEARAEAARQTATLEQQTAAAEQKLRLAQQKLTEFIGASRQLCQTQLDFLTKLPEMDAAAAQSAPAPSVADDTIRIIEQDILKDFSVPTEPKAAEPAAPVQETAAPAPAQEEPKAEEPAAPAEPAPEKDEPSADSLFSTDFKLNLDELKFGRNYSGEN